MYLVDSAAVLLGVLSQLPFLLFLDVVAVEEHDHRDANPGTSSVAKAGSPPGKPAPRCRPPPPEPLHRPPLGLPGAVESATRSGNERDGCRLSRLDDSVRCRLIVEANGPESLANAWGRQELAYPDLYEVGVEKLIYRVRYRQGRKGKDAAFGRRAAHHLVGSGSNRGTPYEEVDVRGVRRFITGFELDSEKFGAVWERGTAVKGAGVAVLTSPPAGG